MLKSTPASRRPLQKSSLVAERLERAILAGRFAVGERLPSEAELGEKYAASRTVIREALKRLSARGIVRTINGSGSYVSGVSMGDLKASLQRYTALVPGGESFLELFDLRIILESGAAAMLAENPTPLRLAPVLKAVEDLAASQENVPVFADADISFHLAVVAATGNHLMQAIHSAIEPQMRKLGGLMYADTVKTGAIYEEHFKIYEAIRSGNPNAASQSMRAHLTASKIQWEQHTGYHDNYPGAGLA